jgi:hypothetical protein
MSSERAPSCARVLVSAWLLASAAGCNAGDRFTTSDASATDQDDGSEDPTLVGNPGGGHRPDASVDGGAPGEDGSLADSGTADASIAPAGPVCVSTELACDGGCVPNDSTHCGVCDSPCVSPDGGVASCGLVSGTYKCGVACNANLTSCGDACVDTQSDPSDCGRCGHGCQGAACISGRCQSWIIANAPASHVGVLGPRAGNSGHALLAADGNDVVWYDDSQGILEASAHGDVDAGVTNLSPVTYSTTRVPADVAMAHGVVVWTLWDVNTGVFLYSAPDMMAGLSASVASLGGNTANDVPSGLVLDAKGANAYFLDSENTNGQSPGNPGLFKCDLNAKSCSKLDAVTTPTAFALPDDVALSGSSLFWTNSGTGSLWRTDYSINRTDTPVTGQHGPCRLVVDDKYVYWLNVTLADSTAGTTASFSINRTSVTTPGVVTPVVGSTPGSPYAIATDGVYLYFSAVDPTQQYWSFDYVPVDGSSPPQSLKDGQEPFAIAVGGGAVFWVNYGDGTIDGIAAP